MTRLRAFWAERQFRPLDGPRNVLLGSGWARSVGGSNPYLTLFSRGRITKAEAEAALASGEIAEVPCARGCTYVVPRDDIPLAITVGQAFQEKGELAGAKKHLDFTGEDLHSQNQAVLEALGDDELDPKEIRARLGDKVISFGAEGKKRGLTTSLPISLGWLQARGHIRRVSVTGRLDGERYRYATWNPSPLSGVELTREQAYEKLAERFFDWLGVATAANFRWFSGLSVTAAKAALAPLDLVTVDGDWLARPSDLEALAKFRPSDEPGVRFVSCLDSTLLLRRDVAALVSDEDASQEMRAENGIVQVRSVMDLASNAILDRGRLVGLWEYDAFAKELVYKTWSPHVSEVKAAATETERFIRDELGDARSFSLDSPESRQPRVAYLRQ